MPLSVVDLMLGLGTALVLALVLAALCGYVRLPRVTAYLVAGVVMGPSGLGSLAECSTDAAPPFWSLLTLREAHLEALSPLSDLALAFIMFHVGGEFVLERFRRVGRRILVISLCEALATGIAVGTLSAVFGTSVEIAVLLGIISMATAPGATLVVVRELDAEGPLAHNLLLLVGLNNLVCLVVYPIVFVWLAGVGSPVLAGLRITATLAGGGLLGFLVAFLVERCGGPREITLLSLSALVLATGLAALSGYRADVLASTLAMGVVCVNASARGREPFDRLDDVAQPLFVVFFILSGAHLDLGSLGIVGILGLTYVTGRSVGKVLGALAGVRLAALGRSTRPLLGLGLLCQAGCAIGLARDSLLSGAAFGPTILTVVLAGVLVFELTGPVVLRSLLVSSGEVMLHSLHPRGVAAHHATSLRGAVVRLARAFNLRGLERLSTGGNLAIEHLMRTNVDAIQHNASFETVLNVLAHGRFDLYPVVAGDDSFLGVITFADLRGVIYEPELSDLVIARDLMSGHDLYVAPTSSFEEALRLFDASDVSCLPVVDTQSPRGRVLVGIVERREVTRAYRESILEKKLEA
ncbi:MAG: cation:proton antiporter [Planctomycetota bacterium]